MVDKSRKLLFVYNADSGIINAVKDAFHKTVLPKRYQCNLCAVTFGPVSMKSEWKKYIQSLDIEIEFLHKDEFRDQYEGEIVPFPAAFLVNGGKPEILITKEEIDGCKTVDDLISLVERSLGSD